MLQFQKTLTTKPSPAQRLMKLIKPKNDQSFSFEYNTDFVVDCVSLVHDVVLLEKGHIKNSASKTDKHNQQEQAAIKISNFIDTIKTAAINESDFDFIKTIGTGAFGCVQLARCKFNNQLYAIKKQSKLKEIQNGLHNSIRTERDVLLKAQNSPWIVKLYYAFQSTSHLFLVLDLLTGGDLAQLMLAHGRPFPESLARFFIAEAATAVNVLHRLGFIHGDLSPSNLLLDSRGHLVLADFGLTLKMNEHTGMAVARNIGTLGYSPPEMFNADEYHSFPRNEAVIGRERDYWSLGIILYEMLHQTLPFWSASEILACERLLTFPVAQNQELKNYRKIKKKVTFADDDNKCQEKSSTFSRKPGSAPRLSIEAKGFIRSLLCRAQQRLGRGRRGFEEVKGHPFFASTKNQITGKPLWSFETLRSVPVGELFPSLEPFLRFSKITDQKDNFKAESDFWVAHNQEHFFSRKCLIQKEQQQLTFEQCIDFVGFTNSGEFQQSLLATDEQNEIAALKAELARKDAQIEELNAALEQWNCQFCREVEEAKMDSKTRRETFI